MRIPNPLGFWALIALPAILGMYWHRPRTGTRRVAGLFLWADVARDMGQHLRRQKRSGTLVLFDLAAAVLLVALTCGSFTLNLESDGAAASWWDAAGRFVLCLGIATLIVLVWRNSRKSASD